MKKRGIKQALKNAIAAGLPVFAPPLSSATYDNAQVLVVFVVAIRAIRDMHQATIREALGYAVARETGAPQQLMAELRLFQEKVKATHDDKFFVDLQFKHKDWLASLGPEHHHTTRITWLQLMCEMFIERLCQVELEIPA